MTPADLIAFEQEIADIFNRGEIRAPVHLYSEGAAAPMIEVFKTIGPDDYVLCSWRSHFQCLLKGVPPERLKADILAGRSISLCYPDFKILSSAIVGGVLPIALGIAWAIKRGGERNRVHCFMGDMTAMTGIARECVAYSYGHDLPIRWIVEDNGKSVMTDTQEVWGGERLSGHVQYESYRYDLTWPHAGAGKRVEF